MRPPPPVNLTVAELRALLEAVSQMTDGNARDFGAWADQTSGARAEWRALLAGEAKLIDALRLARGARRMSQQ